MKSWLSGGLISVRGVFARLLGHSAHFRSCSSSPGPCVEVDEFRVAVSRARGRVVSEILGAAAAALSSREDRGVLVWDGWISFGEWAGLNCGRCARCGVSGRKMAGAMPCAFLPRVLGRFVVDGRVPIPVFVALGGVMSSVGFELVGVPPVECMHIVRSWVKTSGGRVNG